MSNMAHEFDERIRGLLHDSPPRPRD
jgi:hypothetical protein